MHCFGSDAASVLPKVTTLVPHSMSHPQHYRIGKSNYKVAGNENIQVKYIEVASKLSLPSFIILNRFLLAE